LGFDGLLMFIEDYDKHQRDIQLSSITNHHVMGWEWGYFSWLN
jgi:hypothetical protein